MKSILLVDDDRHIRAALSSLLTEAGYEVVSASNGQAALAAISAHKPDLVLLDVMMPVMDGYTTCEEIRKVNRELPIVFLTSLDTDADQIRAFELGADDFVAKTVSDAVLLARIRKTLSRSERFTVVEAPEFMTRTEANVYRLLKSAPGKFFTYREIFDSVSGEGYYADEGAVRSHVSRMRKKIEPLGERIESKRGFGFALFE